MIALQVEKRGNTGKGPARRLRQVGMVPGVVYGNGRDPLSIQVNQKQIETIFHAEETMHQPLELTIGNNGHSILALLKEYQADIISREFSHVDFKQISADQPVEVSVPVRFTGRSQGVKQGGSMKVFARKISVVCLPKDIPSTIELDTTPLSIGHVVHFSDVALPQGCALPSKYTKWPLVSILGKQAEEETPAAAPAAAATSAAPAAAPAKKK